MYPRMKKFTKVPISAKALRQAVQKQPVAVAISTQGLEFLQFHGDNASAIELGTFKSDAYKGDILSCKVPNQNLCGTGMLLMLEYS
jgi:hypothetical protein